MLRLLQINLHHSSTASAELLLTLDEGNFDGALIQEPWISGKGDIKGLTSQQYKLLCSPNEGIKRSAILVKKNLNTFLKSNYSSNDLTVILCEGSGGQKPLLIASAYMSHDKEAPPAELQTLVDEASEKKLDLVIGGDANAHHKIWGSKDINIRGESFLNFILSSNLSIANRGNVPTYIGPTSENVLDITLYTETETCILDNWQVLKKPSLSDHRYISFEISFKTNKTPKPYRNPAKTNWDLYAELVEQQLDGKCPVAIWKSDTLEATVAFLTKTLTAAFERACPLSIPRTKSRPPWWNNQLKITRDSVRKSFTLAKRIDDPGLWTEYRTKLKDFKKELRYAKRTSWRKFCEVIENTSETARLKKILSKSPTLDTLLVKNDGTWTEDSRETLEVLLYTHFPGCLDPVSPNHYTVQRSKP